MKQCLIYNESLRFSRAIEGSLVLIAFFLKNHWLILAVIILMVLGIFSMKLNLIYQLHAGFSKKILKRQAKFIKKESGEINFVRGATAFLLSIGFILIYLGKFVEYAWIYILIVAFLIFLACFVGFCIATLMYVFFKKLFKK